MCPLLHPITFNSSLQLRQAWEGILHPRATDPILVLQTPSLEDPGASRGSRSEGSAGAAHDPPVGLLLMMTGVAAAAALGLSLPGEAPYTNTSCLNGDAVEGWLPCTGETMAATLPLSPVTCPPMESNLLAPCAEHHPGHARAHGVSHPTLLLPEHGNRVKPLDASEVEAPGGTACTQRPPRGLQAGRSGPCGAAGPNPEHAAVGSVPTTLSYSSRVSLSPAVLLKLLVLEEEREMFVLPFSFSLINGLGRGKTKRRARACHSGNCVLRLRERGQSLLRTLEQSSSIGMNEWGASVNNHFQKHGAQQLLGAAS